MSNVHVVKCTCHCRSIYRSLTFYFLQQFCSNILQVFDPWRQYICLKSHNQWYFNRDFKMAAMGWRKTKTKRSATWRKQKRKVGDTRMVYPFPIPLLLYLWSISVSFPSSIRRSSVTGAVEGTSSDLP